MGQIPVECRECRATGWEGAVAGQGACRFCGGCGYRDKPAIDTLTKLKLAVSKQRQQDNAP